MSDDPDRYDLNTLSRFVTTVLYNRPSDDPNWLMAASRWRKDEGIPDQAVTPDMIAAAFALQDMFYGVDLHKKFNLHKRPTKRQRRMTIDQPSFSVVMAALNGEITRDEAINEIRRVQNLGYRKAEAYYDSVRPAAQTTLNTFSDMHRVGGLGEFKICHPEPKPTPDEQALAVSSNKDLKHTEKVNCLLAIYGGTYREAQQRLLKINRV